MADYDKADVKRILMERDCNTAEEAQECIDVFEEELDDALNDTSCLGFPNAEQLIEDHFDLEPDYLIDFLSD